MRHAPLGGLRARALSAPRNALAVVGLIAALACSPATAGVSDFVFASGFEDIAPTSCAAAGATCAADTECCNGLCDRPAGAGTGQCAMLGSCGVAGEPCGIVGASSTCCSGACLDSAGNGSPTCQRIGGCLPADERCTVGSQCCSGSCTASGTTLDGRPILRCAAPATCAPPGELCFASTANCCPPGGGSTGCETATTGLARCLGGTPGCVLPGNTCTDVAECCTETYPGITCQTARSGAQTCCLPAGQSCAFGDACCSGVCAPDANGSLVCSSARLATGAACTTSADCAAGCCEKNALGTLACTTECAVCTAGQIGESCSAASPCCPGLACDAVEATCRVE
jgi:hypothetical protein